MLVIGIVLCVLLGLAVSWQTYAEVSVNTTAQTDAVETARKMTKKQLAAITKDFVHYYLYHGCKVGSSCGFDMDVCFSPLYRNVTHMMLSSSVNTSTNSEYSPRILQKNQVSWKPRSKLRKSSDLAM